MYHTFAVACPPMETTRRQIYNGPLSSSQRYGARSAAWRPVLQRRPDSLRERSACYPGSYPRPYGTRYHTQHGTISTSKMSETNPGRDDDGAMTR